MSNWSILKTGLVYALLYTAMAFFAYLITHLQEF